MDDPPQFRGTADGSGIEWEERTPGDGEVFRWQSGDRAGICVVNEISDGVLIWDSSLGGTTLRLCEGRGSSSKTTLFEDSGTCQPKIRTPSRRAPKALPIRQRRWRRL